MSLTADRRSLLLLALMFSLLLHAVAVALAPMTSAVRLPDAPILLELMPFTPPAPVVRPAEPERARPSVKAVRSLKRAAAPPPAAPAAAVKDEGGEVAAPTAPVPFVFKAKFTGPEPTKAQPGADEQSAGAGGDGAAVVETAPALLREIKPTYPDEARRADVDGDVLLRVTISADGSVESVQVESSPGYGLDVAARNAMLRARFKPATRGGVPVRTTILYRYIFRLD